MSFFSDLNSDLGNAKESKTSSKKDSSKKSNSKDESQAAPAPAKADTAPKPVPEEKSAPAPASEPAPASQPEPQPQSKPAADQPAPETVPYTTDAVFYEGAPSAPNVVIVNAPQGGKEMGTRREDLEQNYDNCQTLGRYIYEFDHGDDMHPELFSWFQTALKYQPDLAREVLSREFYNLLEESPTMSDDAERIIYDLKRKVRFQPVFVEKFGAADKRHEYTGEDGKKAAIDAFRKNFGDTSLKFSDVFDITWNEIDNSGDPVGRASEAEVRRWITSLKKDDQAAQYEAMCLKAPQQKQQNKQQKKDNSQQKTGNKPNGGSGADNGSEP